MAFKRWSVRALGLGLLAALFLSLPGSGSSAAAKERVTLKFAVMVPRTQEFAVEVKRYNRRLAQETDGEVRIRVYWGGAAGSERDVLRKMRMGQIDGTALGLDVLSQFVRECLVLQTPGLFVNYKQVDAVRAALTPEFDKEAYRNGFKIMAWGDVGRLRLFSKEKITRISDFQEARPWLYPQSQVLKFFYKQIGATGVPLDLKEVYGGMQTGMIDTYWSTSAMAAALQWHRTAKYVSAEGMGFINGAVVFRRGVWEQLSDGARNAMTKIVEERAEEDQHDIRETDDRVFRRLLKRGYTGVEAEDPGEWWEAGRKLRKRLVGRVYTQKLVEKAERIALKYATEEQLQYWK